MIAHTFKSSPCKAEAGRSLQVQGHLAYVESSRPARAMQQDHLKEKEKEKWAQC